jgi:formate dehydrogenase maturation protein FdhE
MTDWLVAFDDGLTQRLTRCTVCGSAPVQQWAIWEGTTLSMAYTLCARCHTTDPQRHIVAALMERRYEGVVRPDI